MADRPLRILHLRTVAGTGGGPDKTVLKSCQALQRAGQVCHAFYFLDRSKDTGRLQFLADQLGVRLCVGYEDGPICLGALGQLRQLVRRERYDIIHTHEYKSNAIARLLRSCSRFEIVATAHGYNRTTHREVLYYGLERLLFRWVRRIVVPNRDMFEKIRSIGIPPGRLEIIHNGIEIEGREPPRPHARGQRARLLFLGRLSLEKDATNLIFACKMLVDEGRDIELWLAGDGPERERLESLVSELELADRVGMQGFVEDVPSLLGQVDLLVNPSRTECMPNCILEAMWAGVPIVATAVGGVAEMVRGEHEALLCPPRDSKALAERIRRLLDDPSLATRLAQAGKRRVHERFAFERRMEKMLEMYRRVCEAREGGRA